MTDRTALYIDPTTLHVGIGTDKPSKPFHIQGDMMLSGQIYDGTGFPFSLGGGSWRTLTSNQPSITLVSGSFTETCNVTLQRYSANDMALSVYITGTIVTKPSSTSHDYRFTLPTPVNPTSYPLTTTVGEFWLSATSNAVTTVYKAVAKTIPGINDRVALKYLSGTTEVSLAEINAGFTLSIQGMLAYQTDRYVQTTPTDAITIPGTNIRWIQATYPNPILVPPVGATITQTGRQGLLRYLGDDLVYNVLMEATINTQPTNKSLNYQISLEYPIQQSFYSSNAILGDLWLTVVNGSYVTTYKAYPQVSGGDASNVVVRYVNGTYDESLSDIDAPTFIRLQGNIVYKTTVVASVAIPTQYLPNRLYQDNDGNVAINNSGLPTRARFEVVETSNRPAILIDQRSGADIVQFRSNVNDIKAIINAKGNIGIGTSIAPLPITVKGNMQFDGIMYDGTGQPLWIPGSSVNWQSTPSAPVITVPSGGTWSIQTSTGLWRYVGNEINYNVSLRGTLTTQPTNTTQNFALSVPYPVKLSAYPSNPPVILGELWADVAYQSSSNTFKAYAQVNPTDSNMVTLRVLTGTKDESFSTMLATSTLTLKGQLTYTTTTTPVTVPVAPNYIPTNFTQDQSGQVALNSQNPPRGRLDIVTNSNLPALVVDQQGAGNIAEFIGTSGIKLSSGTTAQRPINPNIGITRINTDKAYAILEYFTGISWIPLGPKDGTSIELAAPSALYIKQNTGTTVNGLYWIQLPYIGPMQVYCDMNTNGGGWMHCGTFSDNNENRGEVASTAQQSGGSHPWGAPLNASQNTGIWEDTTTLGTQSFTADFKNNVWNYYPMTQMLMKDQGNTLRNLFYTNTISSQTLSSFFANRTWGTNASETSSSAYTNNRVYGIGITNFGVADPVLDSGNKTVMLFKFGEINGVQDANKDRSMIAGHAWNAATGVDNPYGIGCMMSSTTNQYWRDIVPSAQNADTPPVNITGGPYNYTMWVR